MPSLPLWVPLWSERLCKCPKATRKTAKCKMQLQKCHFSHSFFVQTMITRKLYKYILACRHFITKLMFITVQSSTTTQRLHSFKFSLVDRAVYSTAWLLSSLVPRPTLSRGEMVWWTKSNFLGLAVTEINIKKVYYKKIITPHYYTTLHYTTSGKKLRKPQVERKK